jgi:hypothetical protein
MSRAEAVRATGCLSDGSFCRDRGTLEALLGPAAWARLPQSVRARFAEAAHAVDYVGEFETIRASALGRGIAWAGRLLGTPIAPHTGNNVPAIVHVGPAGRGVEWRREYRWPGRSASLVRSTKVIAADGKLVEELPACLCMPLDVYESAGVLHFVSRGYYFEFHMPGLRRPLRLTLPHWLSPGTTHVEHIDEAAGWFRFTMTVSHPVLGEVFYQTGRFRESGS